MFDASMIARNLFEMLIIIPFLNQPGVILGSSQEAFDNHLFKAEELLQRKKKAEARNELLLAQESIPEGARASEKANMMSAISELMSEAGYAADGRKLLAKAFPLLLGVECRDDGCRADVALSLNELSATAFQIGMKSEAREGFVSAMELAGKIGNQARRRETQVEVATDMTGCGLVEPVLELASACDDDSDRTFLYSRVVTAYAEKGEFRKAIELVPRLELPKGGFGSASTEVEELRVPVAWMDIAKAQTKRGLKKAALESFNNSVSTATPGLRDRARQLLEVAQEMRAAGYRKEARETLEKAIDAAKELGNRGERENLLEDISELRKKLGIKLEAGKLSEQAKGGSRRERFDSAMKRQTLIGFLLVCALAASMLIAAANSGLIASLINPDIAFILVFITPLLYAAGIYAVATQWFLKRFYAAAGLLLYVVVPLTLPLIMLILALGAYPSLLLSFIPGIVASGMLVPLAVLALLPPAVILAIKTFPDLEIDSTLLNIIFFVLMLAPFLGIAFLAGSNSADMLESARAASLLFLILPFAFNLYVAVDLLIKNSGMYTEMIMLIIPLVYLAFAVIGAVAGAVSFLVSG